MQSLDPLQFSWYNNNNVHKHWLQTAFSYNKEENQRISYCKCTTVKFTSLGRVSLSARRPCFTSSSLSQSFKGNFEHNNMLFLVFPILYHFVGIYEKVNYGGSLDEVNNFKSINKNKFTQSFKGNFSLSNSLPFCRDLWKT